MRLSSISMLGAWLTALTLAFVAAPAQAGASYGGIGASVSRFDAQNAHGSGTPPAGTAYYLIDDSRGGQVASYHVVLNPQSKLNTAELKRLVTARELPPDTKQIKRWKPAPAAAHCAVFKSRWLGRPLYGPYVVVYASSRYQTASAMVSTAPKCRG